MRRGCEVDEQLRAIWPMEMSTTLPCRPNSARLVTKIQANRPVEENLEDAVKAAGGILGIAAGELVQTITMAMHTRQADKITPT